MRVTIVIPVLDELGDLPATVEALGQLVPKPHAVVVADGGSRDGTREWLERNADGAWLRAIDAPRGRGNQMNAAAAEARGDVLLFLHADAALPADGLSRVERALEDPRTLGGAFTIRFYREPDSPRSMPLIARGINFRTRLTRTATGDQAIFVRRSAFDELGGFRPWPLFEDVDLVARLKRLGRFAIVTGPAAISDRRYATFGPWRTTALMWLLRLRYWRGDSPDVLKRSFADVRSSRPSRRS